jgi:hypothetical protein
MTKKKEVKKDESQEDKYLDHKIVICGHDEEDCYV